MVDITFISASPIKDRNNHRACKRMAEVAQQEGFKFTEVISLADYQTLPCSDCNHCKEQEECQYEEVNTLNKRLARTRAIVISSPVYFGTMPAQLKALCDTTRPLRRHGMKLKDKIGAAVTIGNSRNGGQETALQTIHNWMHIQGMLIVGDNSHYGGTLQVPVMEDQTGLKTLEDTVKKVCDILSRLR